MFKKRMLINLPAGSGKTLIALKSAELNKCQRVLVVCPAFLKLNWSYELGKWFGNELWGEPQIISDVEGISKLQYYKRLFAIVGYPFFQKKGQVKFLQKQHWDLVICDESHFLRKWEARRCKDVVMKICRLRERLLFLSATPLISSAADLHPTFALMQPGEWGKYGDFCNRYCRTVHDPFSPRGFKYVGINPDNAFELRRRAKEFIFTAKKEVILAELPPKRVIDVPVMVGKFNRPDDIAEMLEQIIETGDDDEIKTERERIGKAKVKAVLEFLETIPSSEPVVIFTWHRSVGEELLEKISEIQDAEIIIGGLSEKRRMQRVIDFTEKKFDRLIVSIASGGLGLNLQRASIAIFAELPYSFAEFEQASDRIHRIGSKKRVRIYKVLAVDSIDEDINKIIETKRHAAEHAGVLT